MQMHLRPRCTRKTVKVAAIVLSVFLSSPNMAPTLRPNCILTATIGKTHAENRMKGRRKKDRKNPEGGKQEGATHYGLEKRNALVCSK